MPPRQDSNSKVKKKVGKTIRMEVKSMILKLEDRGCSTSSIGRELNLLRMTVQTILKDKEKLITAPPSVSLNSTIIRKRNALICEMEKLLHTWIQNQTQRRVNLSLAIIQSKALSIINTLQNKHDQPNIDEITTDIVDLANRLPDIVVTADDIDDLLSSHSQELTDEDLIELEAQVQEEAIE
ncbi:unnamed protein product [Hermetia illucens]|uniref:Uncharacterized protein n=1 Tax=Hermetia illucens TaxID=343691 RepID=A0A7R8UB79_HERIL|nr:unnamed protein product [Hermetia illucens]